MYRAFLAILAAVGVDAATSACGNCECTTNLEDGDESSMLQTSKDKEVMEMRTVLKAVREEMANMRKEIEQLKNNNAAGLARTEAHIMAIESKWSYKDGVRIPGSHYVFEAAKKIFVDHEDNCNTILDTYKVFLQLLNEKRSNDDLKNSCEYASILYHGFEPSVSIYQDQTHCYDNVWDDATKEEYRTLMGGVKATGFPFTINGEINPEFVELIDAASQKQCEAFIREQ